MPRGTTQAALLRIDSSSWGWFGLELLAMLEFNSISTSHSSSTRLVFRILHNWSFCNRFCSQMSGELVKTDPATQCIDPQNAHTSLLKLKTELQTVS